ncbi:FkbM family methyltransferase [Desulfonatronum thioautotrophicum]|uniref:FkbM family methyltransferase n=1 Tax=Desulfonatronum thioautotrophicum TaxID=617001 RepID=UPI0005EB7390|nr:FkbM family methyltransferase [Desulfonatronum thioautotrophicum]
MLGCQYSYDIMDHDSDMMPEDIQYLSKSSKALSNLINIKTEDQLKIIVPDTLQCLSTFVYLEQENWFEQELELVRQYLKPGMIALDIGSCFGAYALPMAALVGEQGQVFAFEPNENCCRYLEKSKKANRLDNLHVIRKAVADCSQSSFINEAISPEFSSVSSIPDRMKQEVKSLSLDNWWKKNDHPNVDLLKVDVNGHEPIVINGAKKLLTKTSPLIIFSLNSPFSLQPKDLQKRTRLSVNLFKKLGYSIYTYLPELNVLSAHDDIQCPDPSQINLVACKPELAAYLKESGLMLTTIYSLPRVKDDSWYIHLSRLPFAEPMLQQWENNCPDKGTPYMSAFNLLCAAQNINNYSASQRYILLRSAYHIFSSIYNNKSISGSLSFSLARVCVDLGQKNMAFNILQQLKNDILNGKGGDFSLPFITPIKKFDTSQVKSSLENWVIASCIESMLNLSNYSGYFFNKYDLELYRMLLGNPEISIESQRRINLFAFQKQQKKSDHEFKKKTPIVTFIMLSMSYRSQDNLTMAESIIQAGLSKYPDNIMLEEELAEISYARKDWHQAALLFAKICKKTEEKTPLRIIDRLKNSIDQTPDKENRIKIWKSTCSTKGQKAELSCSKLLDGNYEEALEIFTSLVKDVFSDDKTRGLWIDSFLCLHDCIKKVDSPPSCKTKDTKKTLPYKKVIVSGMGWSGSGAVYDYLREFSLVYPISGELKFIQADPGLYTLWKKSGDVDLFNKDILAFFILSLMGFGASRDWNSAIAAFFARSMSLSRKKRLYARGINLFCKEAKKCFVNNVFDKNIFKSMANILWDTIAYVNGAKKNNIVLLDNVFQGSKIHAIDFLDNTHVFCTFRDPRSNYIALLNESPFFRHTVEQYVQIYKKYRLQFDKLYNSISNNKSVTIVQFENFVLSEEYRLRMAKILNLSCSVQEKYRFFQPWVSEKNVFLHENYEIQDEIRLIEKELPEYCIDVHRLKQEDC